MWYFYIALNLLAFALYGIDKAKARRGAWRIPEKILLGAGICGGALGALAGMRFFRHKTRHWYFTVINTAALIAHADFVIWLCR